MAKIAGSVWVDGSTLHYVDKNNAEWFFTGTVVASPAGAPVVGSIWVSGSFVNYIDSLNRVRQLPVVLVTSRVGVGAVSGSIWVDTAANTNFSLHFIDASQNEQAAHGDGGHTDVTHGDVLASHTDAHSDTTVTHTDVAHQDVAASHTDVAAHSDGVHSDV